jgi:type II secretory pathway pseudopilin PulG
MLIKKVLCAFLFATIFNLGLFAQENMVKIQIREPQKLIEQLDKYVFGNGLHEKESDPFFAPIQLALLTTIHAFEPMLGVKVNEVLMVLNGNIDINVSAEKIVRVRVDYPTKEITEKNVLLIKNLFASKAGIVLTEKKDGEISCYSDEVNSMFYMSSLNNGVYLQIGSFKLSEDGKKKISYALPPLSKSDAGANINVQLTADLMKEALKESALLNSLYGQGINYAFSFKDNSIDVHSELKVSKNSLIQSFIPQAPISSAAYKSISQKTSFAIASKFNFPQLLQSLSLTKEFPELKDMPQYIEVAKKGFTKFTQLDLQNDILSHMGDEMVISAIPDEEAGGNPLLSMMQLNSLYFAAPLKNATAFEASLVKMLTAVGQIELATPISTTGDGVKTIQLEGAKVYYLKFAQGLLTPCFMIKENMLFVSTNLPTLDYINKNIKTWGSLADSKDFQDKVPVKNATVFYFDKYNGDPKRPNYLAHLTSATVLGSLIVCNYVGDAKLNPNISGEPFRMAASLLKPIVAAIDFTQYPAAKNFQLTYGDNYSYWVFENNAIQVYQKSGHIVNGSMGLMPIVAVTAIVATIAVPQLLDARRHSNQRAAIGNLRSFATDQETFKADNNSYTIIKLMAASKKIDLTVPKSGYTFTDLFKNPNEDFFAVLASPTVWGSTGKYHYIITNDGNIRMWDKKELPFALTLEASQESVDIINKLPAAR